MRLLFRMFAIAFGFFAGCLAAGLAYVFLARLVVPEDFGTVGELELTVTLVVGVVGISSLFARAVLLPALAIISLFEFVRVRDWLSHALAGGLLALAVTSVPLLGSGGAAEPAEFDPVRLIAIHVASAIIGATVYWMLTGRNAGNWLPSENQPGPADPDQR